MSKPKTCEKCGAVGVPADDSLCHPCRIEEDQGPEARRRYLESIGRKGGTAKSKQKGLRDVELPPLVDHAAAETWSDRIGRAAATGRIGSRAANAALRAVREWRQAHDAGAVSERLEELLDALAEWRETGDPEPVLELVEGGA